MSSDGTFTGTEPSVAQKMELQQEEKRRIAQFAAGLIQPDDFVYLTVERNQELFEDVETVVWRDEVPEKDE